MQQRQPWHIVFDGEANNLLNSETIDYSTVPYKLNKEFKLHSFVVDVLMDNGKSYLYGFHDGDKFVFDGSQIDTVVEGETYTLEAGYEPVDYIHRPLADLAGFIAAIPAGSTVVGHNIIGYDLLVIKLVYGIPFEIERNMAMDCPLGNDYWGNTPVNFDDTLVRAKTLNPDRFGGNSLDALSQQGPVHKIAFRHHLPKNKRFAHFGADMFYYNIFDVKSNRQVAKTLDYEMQDYNWGHKWDAAIKLEKATLDLIVRQEHRGFVFNSELAEANIAELDAMMEERRIKIEAILPDRPATMVVQNNSVPPKKQFKQNGDMAALTEKFAVKMGAVIEDGKFIWQGQEFTLPLPQEPLITTMPASVGDTTHIKDWLVGLGWVPLEYKEKDITVNTKKIALCPEKLDTAIERYIAQTIASSFMYDRVSHLRGMAKTPSRVKLGPAQAERILREEFTRRRERKSGIKVLTNPSFTTGQEKEMCKNLLRFIEENPEYAHITDIVEYLTYRHRRNSILGGGMSFEEFDDDDDEQTAKGYLANVRADGRIPTPADTCGAATSRMKHRLVANVPRVTTLYGKKMRALFGVDDTCFQLGYDFDSLEAREEAHFCWDFEEGEAKEYCQSLLMEKPHDVHSMMARKISEIIAKDFARGPAKSVKYGCLPVDNSQVLTLDGWKGYSELYIGQKVLSYNPATGLIEEDTVKAIQHYKDAEIVQLKQKGFCIEVTEDHRWYGKRRTGRGQTRREEELFFRTFDMTGEHSILASAPREAIEGTVPPEVAAFFGWLTSDGYFKWSEPTLRTSSSHGRLQGVVGSIAQDSKKFVAELRDCLVQVGAEYTEAVRGTMHIFHLKSAWLRAMLDKWVGREQKHAVDWCALVMQMGQESLAAFYNAFFLADGHKLLAGREAISQNDGEIFDAIRLCMFLLGMNCGVSRKGVDSRCYTITEKSSNFIGTQRMVQSDAGNKDVFCISTENQTFIMRQGAFIGITGNCTYGAQAGKVAKTIGSDLATGNLVFDAFWEAASPLKHLKEALQSEWELYSRKKIVGIDNRLVPTRSAHAILNSKFQSSGVICAKRAMVLHDRKLKAAGLLVDFFKDSLDGREWCQQLIAYHDEAQVEVSRKSVKFYRKQTKEEVQAFKDVESTVGRIWSDIKESPKGGFFMGYCHAGQLAAEAVAEVGKDFGMNVDLTAGYILGSNWADCH